MILMPGHFVDNPWRRQFWTKKYYKTKLKFIKKMHYNMFFDIFLIEEWCLSYLYLFGLFGLGGSPGLLLPMEMFDGLTIDRRLTTFFKLDGEDLPLDSLDKLHTKTCEIKRNLTKTFFWFRLDCDFYNS